MKQNTILPLLALTGVQAAAPALTYTVQPVAWEPAGTVTVTYTRTFTDYCGCGIPGVPTIIGPIGTSSSTSTSTSTSTGGNTVNPGSTTSSTTTTALTGSVPPATVSTSLTTTTTTGGNTVNPGSTTSSTTTTTTASTGSVPPDTVTTSLASTTTTPTGAATTTTTPITTTTTTNSAAPVVTDQAYIDTVLRHHNVHRANHSAAALTWSPTLANIARVLAESCVYGHNQSISADQVGYYGQNIGAGYPSNQMGAFITEGLYNSEVNAYTYYGTEPNGNTFSQWGHFSQIVWAATTQVGCYTADCSANPNGLQNAAGIPPYFVVCNYQPGGNSGNYAGNVLASVGNPTVFANYECPSNLNCVGPTA